MIRVAYVGDLSADGGSRAGCEALDLVLEGCKERDLMTSVSIRKE